MIYYSPGDSRIDVVYRFSTLDRERYDAKTPRDKVDFQFTKLKKATKNLEELNE